MWLTGIFQNKGNRKIDVREFRQIFSDYYLSLTLYASKFISDIDVCKDVVQEVLIRFWQENEKLRNKNLIKPYLYKAVRNKALNVKKKNRKHRVLEEFFDPLNEELKTPEHSNAFAKIAYEDLQKDLEAAVNELPVQRQIIFRMSRFQNMKHKEIAEELGISPKTVETQIYRSLAFLREKLKTYLE